MNLSDSYRLSRLRWMYDLGIIYKVKREPIDFSALKDWEPTSEYIPVPANGDDKESY